MWQFTFGHIEAKILPPEVSMEVSVCSGTPTPAILSGVRASFPMEEQDNFACLGIDIGDDFL